MGGASGGHVYQGLQIHSLWLRATPSRSYRLTETTECQERPDRQHSIVPGKQTLRLAPVGRSEH